MASPEIEREVDDFANNYPLKRRTIIDRLQIVHNGRDYDKQWRQVLKDMAEVQFLDKIL